MVVVERTIQLIFVTPLEYSTVETLKKTLIWRIKPKKESNLPVRLRRSSEKRIRLKCLRKRFKMSKILSFLYIMRKS